MSYGEKTKLLWTKPEYRKMMMRVHKVPAGWNRVENWKQCPVCNKEFRSAPSSKQIFCTKKCYSKFQLKERPGYAAIHTWVNRQRGKANRCEHCGKMEGKFEWANKSQRYKRDVKDWISLCHSCHRKYDSKVNWQKALCIAPLKQNKNY